MPGRSSSVAVICALLRVLVEEMLRYNANRHRGKVEVGGGLRGGREREKRGIRQ